MSTILSLGIESAAGLMPIPTHAENYYFGIIGEICKLMDLIIDEN